MSIILNVSGCFLKRKKKYSRTHVGNVLIRFERNVFFEVVNI